MKNKTNPKNALLKKNDFPLFPLITIVAVPFMLRRRKGTESTQEKQAKPSQSSKGLL
jgi:hypothetical protein